MNNTPTTYHELFNLLSNKDAPFVQPNADGEITFEDAKKLFDAFAKLKDLHFEADDNGCSIRAGLMQNILIACGVRTASIMVICGYDSKWNYHFAPEVTLKKSSTPMVLDPTSETRPVTREQWCENNHASLKDLTKPDYVLVGTTKPAEDLKKLLSFSRNQALHAP